MKRNFHLFPQLSLRWLLLLVGACAVLLGGLSFRIKQQQASITRLRDIGGQLERPNLTLATWISGISIDSVQFLGPEVGDESVDDIGPAAVTLNVQRLTFMETRLTPTGIQRLYAWLPDAEIRAVNPSPLPERAIPIEPRDIR